MYKRIAQQYLAAGGTHACGKSTISYAWISPTGEVHPLHGYEHGDWAKEYVQAHPGLLEKMGGFDTAGWTGVLLRLGWLQVTNSRAVEAYTESLPPQAAWDAMISLVVDCVTSKMMDPETDEIWVGSAGNSTRMTPAKFVEKFGGRRAVEKMFSGLDKTASNCSQVSFSLAWVDPAGKVHYLDGKVGHPQWAQEYLFKHPGDMARTQIFADLKKHLGEELAVSRAAIDGVNTLLNLGWIKVSNPTEIQVWEHTTPTPQAWHAVAEIVAECVGEGHLPPEDDRLIVWTHTTSHYMTPGDFVSKYGGNRLTDQMFKTLMSRTAKGDQGCDLKHPSYGWISPEGTLHKLYGTVHEYWAEKWVKSDFSEGGLRDKWQEWKKEWAYATPYHTLLRLGWLKVSNAGSVQTWEESAVAQPAWDTMVSLVVSCIVEGRRDPEEGEVWVGSNDGDHRLTPVAFVQKYGGRAVVDKMFRALSLQSGTYSQSGAARMASKYLSGRETFDAQNLRHYFDAFLAALKSGSLPKIKSLARQTDKYKLEMESPFLKMTQSGIEWSYNTLLEDIASFGEVRDAGDLRARSYRHSMDSQDWRVLQNRMSSAVRDVNSLDSDLEAQFTAGSYHVALMTDPDVDWTEEKAHNVRDILGQVESRLSRAGFGKYVGGTVRAYPGTTLPESSAGVGQKDTVAWYLPAFDVFAMSGEDSGENRGIIRSMIHEHGHRVYYKLLPGNARSEWEDFYKANTGNPAEWIAKVLTAWGKYLSEVGADIDQEVVEEGGEEVRGRDPKTGIRPFTESLPHSSDLWMWAVMFHNFANIGFYQDLVEDQKRIQTFLMPVTAYSAASPQELYAEVFADIVLKGPRSIHPVVLDAMKRATPGLKAGAIKRLKKPSSGGCLAYETSYAWIGPDGTIHKCSTSHNSWAVKHAMERGWMEEVDVPYYGDKDIETALNLLYSKGYIRCSNFRSFEAEEVGSPAQAWESAAAISAECMTQDNADQIVLAYQRDSFGSTKTYSVADFIKKFGGRAMVEEAFGRLIRSASCFESKHGAAWIEPNGTVHEDIGEHRNWATRWMIENHKEQSTGWVPGGSWDAETYFQRTGAAEGYLLAHGWIHVVTWTTFYAKKLSGPAFRALVDLMVRCAAFRAQVTDPEHVDVWWSKSYGRDTQKINLIDFLKTYGTRADVEALFAGAMEQSMSQKVASKYLTGAHVAVPDGMRVIDNAGYKDLTGIRRIPIARGSDGTVVIGNEAIDEAGARISGKPYMTDDVMEKLFDGSPLVCEEKVDGHPTIIIYGGYTFFCEGLRVQHSVDYDNVPYSQEGWPDMVVVYDILDGEMEPPYSKGQGTGKWLSRSEKESLCQFVGAPLVPVVWEGHVDPEGLPKLADRISSFSGGSKAEGIVLKNYRTGVFGKFINLEFQSRLSDESLHPGGIHPMQRGVKNTRKWGFLSKNPVPSASIYYAELREGHFVLYHTDLKDAWNWAYPVKVSITDSTVDLDVSYKQNMNRRPAPSNSGRDPADGPSYVIPSGNTAFTDGNTNVDLIKLLKHLLKDDPRVTRDFKVVGSERHRGQTVGDVVGEPRDVDVAIGYGPKGHLRPLVAYHGTSMMRAKQILKQGLIPGKGKEYVDKIPGHSNKNIYLTVNPESAENYATRQAIWDKTNEAAVLQVTIPPEALPNLTFDEDAMGGWVELLRPYTLTVADPSQFNGLAKGESYVMKEQIHHRTLFERMLSGAWVDDAEYRALVADVYNPKKYIKNSIRLGLVPYQGIIPASWIRLYRSYPKIKYPAGVRFEEYQQIRHDTQDKMVRHVASMWLSQ